MPIDDGGTQCDGEINSNDGYKEVYNDDLPNIARAVVRETGPGNCPESGEVNSKSLQKWATTPRRDPQEV